MKIIDLIMDDDKLRFAVTFVFFQVVMTFGSISKEWSISHHCEKSGHVVMAITGNEMECKITRKG